MIEKTCPSCNALIGVEDFKLILVEKSQIKSFTSTGISWTGPSADSLQRVEKPAFVPTVRNDFVGTIDTPVRAPSVPSDVVVPWLNAAIIGGIGGILSTMIWSFRNGPAPGFVFVGVSSACAGFWWLKNQGDAKSTLWKEEKHLGKDLDGDGHIGKPQSNRPVVVQIWSNGSYKKRYCGLDEKQARAVAQAILGDGAKFTRETLCKKSKCFPIDKYSNLIEMWIGLGMLEKKGEHENAPVSLTDAGLTFLGQHYPPAPRD